MLNEYPVNRWRWFAGVQPCRRIFFIDNLAGWNA